MTDSSTVPNRRGGGSLRNSLCICELTVNKFIMLNDERSTVEWKDVMCVLVLLSPLQVTSTPVTKPPVRSQGSAPFMLGPYVLLDKASQVFNAFIIRLWKGEAANLGKPLIRSSTIQVADICGGVNPVESQLLQPDGTDDVNPTETT